jgi:hypothetical protein
MELQTTTHLLRISLASQKKMGYDAPSLVDMWWDHFSSRIQLMRTYIRIKKYN